MHSITLKNTTIHGINNAMDRKNINRGFKKLRVWQDAVALYVLACKIFANFPLEFKKVAAILAAHWIQFVAQYKRWISPVVFEPDIAF